MATSRSATLPAAKPFLLDTRDALVLKGAAIVSIVLHNYCHLLGPVKENQVDFDEARFLVFWRSVLDPGQTVQALFSFLGHYGVQMFIFLSAYGLAVRYWDAPQRWASFMGSRIRKIYPTFFLAIVAWMLYMSLGGVNPWEIVRRRSGDLAFTVLGIQNLVPGADLPPVGPWWFLPFIMQFYCIWPALRWFVRRYGMRGQIALAGVSMALVYVANDHLVARWSINLLETPIGHAPEICLGILVARHGFVPGSGSFVLGGLLLVAGNMYRSLWPFSFVGALLLMLAASRVAMQHRARAAFLEKLGVCSMALFFVNGFVRLPFVAIAQQKPLVWDLLLGIGSLTLTVLIARSLHKTERMLQSIARTSAPS